MNIVHIAYLFLVLSFFITGTLAVVDLLPFFIPMLIGIGCVINQLDQIILILERNSSCTESSRRS